MELFDNKFRRKKNKIKLTSDKIDKKKSCNIKFQKKFSKLKFINPFLNCFRFHQDSILNVLPNSVNLLSYIDSGGCPPVRVKF